MTLRRLEVTPPPVILGDIIGGRWTGALTIAHGSQRTVLDWVNGELVLIRPSDPGRTFGAWLFHKQLTDEATGREIAGYPPRELVQRFHESRLFDSGRRNSYLREWTRALFVPLVSLTEGTAAFEDEDAIDPDYRIFFQSPGPLIVEGIRSISNGLVIRSSLGDISRRIEVDTDPAFPVEDLPLIEKEREMAQSLESGATLETFLQQWKNESLAAARVAIMLLTLGVWIEARESETTVDPRPAIDDTERDLLLLSQLSPSDTKSIAALKLSKRLPTMDLYEILDMPHGAAGSVLAERADRLKREHDLSKYPPVMSEIVASIHTAIERARTILSHPAKRKEYDQLLARGGIGDKAHLDQYVARRAIAISNLDRARELHLKNDFYGAILLLRQAVRFDPGNAEAWHLLGDSEARNPQWRRNAAVSFQKSLAADPEYVESMISLADLYQQQGLQARARSYYEDALRIDPENTVAASRLEKMTS